MVLLFVVAATAAVVILIFLFYFAFRFVFCFVFPFLNSSPQKKTIDSFGHLKPLSIHKR